MKTSKQKLQHLLAQEKKLIRVNQLGVDFADKLNPYVREKYRDLWQAAQVDDDY